MKYLEWITESKTYTVPKSGVYKVICVGGGASGVANLTHGVISNAGQSTSFGSYLSADGGDICHNETSVADANYPSCGQNGYDGLDYGSMSVKSAEADLFKTIGYNKYVEAGTGFGYGAGGGGYNVRVPKYTYGNNQTGNGLALKHKGGRCGKMISTIVDLTEGEQIPCVVGKGGSTIFALADIELKLFGDSTTHVTGNSIKEVPEALSKGITSGADGVIIVQYIGASM